MTRYYLSQKNDSMGIKSGLSLYTQNSIDRIQIYMSLKIDRPKGVPNREFGQLCDIWNHFSIYQFIRWLDLKAQNLPADDPKYWDFKPEDIPYPFISYQKWSDEIYTLKKTIVDLRTSYNQKLEKMKKKYESKLLLLELQNEKLRKKITAYQKVRK